MELKCHHCGKELSVNQMSRFDQKNCDLVGAITTVTLRCVSCGHLTMVPLPHQFKAKVIKK